MLPEHKNRKEIPEYRIWKGMRARCTSACNKNISYQKKNIQVCDRWNDFILFYEDMGKRPTIKHSIERRDNDKGYCTDNCYWATASEQAKNRGSFNRVHTINGESKVLKDWAKHFNIKYTTLYMSIVQHNRTLEEAVVNIRKKKTVTINGVDKSIHQWCIHFNIAQSTYYRRIKRGMNTVKALTYTSTELAY